MSKQRASFSYILLLIPVVILSGLFISCLPTLTNAKAEAVIYSIKPAFLKHYAVPYRSHYSMGYLNSNQHFKQKDPMYLKQSSMIGDNIFQIEASDAIDGVKYSQPDIAYSLLNLNSAMKVPSTFSKHKLLQISAENPSPVNFHDQILPLQSSKDPVKPMQDIRYLDSTVDEETNVSTLDGESSNKLDNKKTENVLQNHSYVTDTANLFNQGRNFTDSSDNLVSVSSDAVLSYEIPFSEFNESSMRNSSIKQNSNVISDVPSHHSLDANNSTLLPIFKTMQPGYTTQSSVQYNTHVYIDYINYTNLTDDIVSSSIFPSTNNDENVTNSLPSTDMEKKLSSGTVAGIVIAVLVTVTLLSSAVIYILYRKFNGKCTSVVESKFNTDNCGYLDDSLRSSIYLNNHIELPKESSEEMTSLDNDSFLNSLETMTIQNYWADNSKNTKV